MKKTKEIFEKIKEAKPNQKMIFFGLVVIILFVIKLLQPKEEEKENKVSSVLKELKEIDISSLSTSQGVATQETLDSYSNGVLWFIDLPYNFFIHQGASSELAGVLTFAAISFFIYTLFYFLGWWAEKKSKTDNEGKNGLIQKVSGLIRSIGVPIRNLGLVILTVTAILVTVPLLQKTGLLLAQSSTPSEEVATLKKELFVVDAPARAWPNELGHTERFTLSGITDGLLIEMPHLNWIKGQDLRFTSCIDLISPQPWRSVMPPVIFTIEINSIGKYTVAKPASEFLEWLKKNRLERTPFLLEIRILQVGREIGSGQAFCPSIREEFVTL